MKKFLRAFLFLLADVLIAAIAIFAALAVHESFNITAVVAKHLEEYVRSLPYLLACSAISAVLLTNHKVLWQFASAKDMLRLVASAVFTATLYAVSVKLSGFTFPLGVYVTAGLFMVLLMMGFRVVLRFILNRRTLKRKLDAGVMTSKLAGNIMIIGAGNAAGLLIHDIQNNYATHKCKVCCAIDDAPEKVGHSICGVKIVGGRDTIVENAKKYDIKTIIFAIPSMKRSNRSVILDICAKTGCTVKVLPSFTSYIDGAVSASSVRDISIEDLLGRDPVNIDIEKIMGYVENKTILVTGGGGSIGSELCRQLATHKPKKLIIFDIYENNAYDILNELTRKYPDLDVLALIGSVRDTERLDSIFSTYKPDIVYHAAAHKHVPLMEDSPNEAIKNYVFGTLKTVRAADKHGVKRFVLISTDKAVNPTNVMGATKRICEMIIQTFNKHSKTEFVAVRFGNVLGSNGSVIPLFKKQIAEGGPVTVTHPEITRFFMTIPEAVSLVLQAGSLAKGGEIFVLDMGKSVKIVSLAENLIRLSGFKPYEDIKIEFTGLRPGEKLYEEILMDEEGLSQTENNLIHIGKPIEMDEDEFLKKLQKLYDSMYDDTVAMRELIHDVVPTYKMPEDK